VTREGLEALERTGGVRADSDPQWRAYQALFIALGSMLLEPLLQRGLDGHAFDPEVVRRRSVANLDFFTHGLLTS
jgi:hypothetical protein